MKRLDSWEVMKVLEQNGWDITSDEQNSKGMVRLGIEMPHRSAPQEIPESLKNALESKFGKGNIEFSQGHMRSAPEIKRWAIVYMEKQDASDFNESKKFKAPATTASDTDMLVDGMCSNVNEMMHNSDGLFFERCPEGYMLSGLYADRIRNKVGNDKEAFWQKFNEILETMGFDSYDDDFQIVSVDNSIIIAAR